MFTICGGCGLGVDCHSRIDKKWLCDDCTIDWESQQEDEEGIGGEGKDHDG